MGLGDWYLTCKQSIYEETRLRVVPLSLSPSCVTRNKKRTKLLRELLGIGNTRASRPQDFTRPFFPSDIFTVNVDGLRERGTTRSIIVVYDETRNWANVH